VPQAFGTFKNNLVLRCVCTDCNQFFGDKLELSFNRDTGEGLVRPYFGLRADVAETSESLPLALHLPSDWRGARVRMHQKPGGGRPPFEVLPQIAVKRGDSWDWIIEDDISCERLTGLLDQEADLRIACNSAEEFLRLSEKLHAAGVRFGNVTRYDINSLPDEGLRVTHQYELTHPQARCIAKIAFNYMAYNLGPGFALHESFDEVRAYIRYGDLSCQQAFVYIRDQSLLREEQMGGKVTNGHILVVDWGVDPGHVVGHVALFNLVRYNIALSRNYVGLWVPLGIGHHFDATSGKISKLIALGANVPATLEG
jgi:hypothetical protein